MPFDPNLPRFDGDQIHQADLRRLSDSLRLLQRYFADNFREGGQKDTPGVPVIDTFPGIVRADGGSSGTPQYTDGIRYYLDRAMTREGLHASDVYNATAEDIPGFKEIITATNLAALPAGGSLLPVATGTIVQCFRLANRGTGSTDGATTPSQPLYVFYWLPPANVLARLDSTAAGGGCYNGTVFTGVMSADGTSNFTLPQGLSAGQACIVENLDEQGQPTHWLQADGSTYAEGVYAGTSSAAGDDGAAPPPIVRVQRGIYRLSGPPTFGSSSSRTTAASDTWTRSTTTAGANYGDTPITLWIATGCYYDPTAATPQLMQHMRQVTVAADGRVATLSAETDYVIDTPEACA